MRDAGVAQQSLLLLFCVVFTTCVDGFTVEGNEWAFGSEIHVCLKSPVNSACLLMGLFKVTINVNCWAVIKALVHGTRFHLRGSNIVPLSFSSAGHLLLLQLQQCDIGDCGLNY